MKKVLLKVLEPIRATLLVAFAIGLGIAVHPMFFLAALLIAVAAFGEGFKHRTIIGLAAILIVVASNSSAVGSAKAKEKAQTGGIQPFTYGNVVAHFKAAGLRTTEVQKRCTTFSRANGRIPTFTTIASSWLKTPMKTFKSRFI